MYVLRVRCGYVPSVLQASLDRESNRKTGPSDAQLAESARR